MKNKIAKLKELYAKIKNQIDGITEKSCISCVKGCGECCKRFEPYISVLEAVPVAYYLKNNPEKYKLYQENNAKNKIEWYACPLYDDENSNHCTIYSERPLICRLFGFSANRTRQNEIVFSSCQKIEETMPEKIQMAKILAQKGFDLPIYQDIATAIQNIDFEMATDYHPFSKSVDIALEQYDEIMKNAFESRSDNESLSFSYFLRKKICDESI